ncbi:MAG: O-antigen ligase family protein [Collimonas pratensis]|uniref:O-antigen ligase family protein n=1 Tax=Collimonas pratensis TaxID=279113 RepID=UPI003C7211E1
MRYLKFVILFIVMCFPVLTMTVKGGANTCIYSLLLLSLVYFVFQHKQDAFSFSYLLRKYWPMHLAMAGMIFAILVNQISTSDFFLKTYDTSSRLAFFLPITWLLLQISASDLKLFQWGLVAGAVGSAIKIEWIGLNQSSMPGIIDFMNRIPYGDVSLMLGILSLLSIGWNRRGDKFSVAIKVIGGISGIYASYLSEARGGWIALPILAFVILSMLNKTKLNHRFAIFAIALILMVSTYSFNKIIQDRVHAAASDITKYVDGENQDTSVGIRFQLWRGSWVLFKEHPVFGVGREEFYPDALQDLAKRHVITQQATDFGHSHNEFFYNMATLGIFGLLAILAIFFVPGYYFLQATRHSDRDIKTAGRMGLTLCLGFLIFGLTEAIFFMPAICAFFSMSVAVCFAFVVKRKEALASS